MGTPDTFGANFIQLKTGDCVFDHFKVGDRITMPDGVYVGFEGAVVIKEGFFIAEFPSEEVVDKWGGQINIDASNPVKQVVDEMVAKYKQM